MNMAAAASAKPAGARPPTGRPEKVRLGDVLVQQRLISQDQLQQTLELQQQTGKKVGRLLIESGVITEELLADALARQLRVPYVNLKTFPFRADVVKLLPESVARRFRALVLEDKGDSLLVAMADPLDLFAYDEITRLLKRNVSIAAVPESQLALACDRLYRRTEEISGLARALEKDLGDAVDFGELTASAGAEGAPVVRLLQSLFEDASQVKASDIHIEPHGNRAADPGAGGRRAADPDPGRETYRCRAGAAHQADGRSGYFRKTPAAGRPLQRAPEGSDHRRALVHHAQHLW